MKIIYRALRAIFLWITPIIIVGLSIIITSTGAELYKSTFRSNSFYTEVSDILTNSTPEKITDPNNLPNAIVLYSLTKEFASASWIQNLFEQNIDLTTTWLRGEEKDWVVYVPTSDIDTALKNRFDSTVKNIATESTNLPTCNAAEENNLKQNGFSGVVGNICLPASVKNGGETFSSFLNINNQTDRLNTVIPNNQLNQLSDRFPVSSLAGIIQQNENTNQLLNTFRTTILRVQKLTIPISISILLILVLLLILAKISGYNSIQQLQNILFTTAISTLGLSIVVIFSLGLTAYFSAWANNFILPGLITGKITELLTWKIVNIILLWVSPALYTSVVFLILSLLLKIQQSFLLKNQKSKNEQILSYQAHPEQTTTLDGQFRNQINSTKNEKNNLTKDSYETYYNPETLSAVIPPELTDINDTKGNQQFYSVDDDSTKEYDLDSLTQPSEKNNQSTQENNKIRGL